MERVIEKEIHMLMANSDKHKTVDDILAEYKLPMLVKIAMGLDRMAFRSCQYPKPNLEGMLKDVLIERKKRLNDGFQWTEDNKARFLIVNDQLYEACEKGWEEALETAEILEKRIKWRDSFLKDYEIEVAIIAYPKVTSDKEYKVGECLGVEMLRGMREHISHCHYKRIRTDNEKPIIIDKRTN